MVCFAQHIPVFLLNSVFVIFLVTKIFSTIIKKYYV